MADNVFTLHISTPDKQFFAGPVQSLVLTTTDGEIGIMAGHTPLVAALVPAPLRLLQPDETDWREAAVTGGFARVKGNEVWIFADTAEWPEDIVESRALHAKRRAEQRIQAHASELEYMRSRVALERALTRLSVKRHSGINH